MHSLVEAGNVVKDGWNGYNVLHDAASRVAALDLGFLPSAEVRSLARFEFLRRTGTLDVEGGERLSFFSPKRSGPGRTPAGRALPE